VLPGSKECTRSRRGVYRLYATPVVCFDLVSTSPPQWTLGALETSKGWTGDGQHPSRWYDVPAADEELCWLLVMSEHPLST